MITYISLFIGMCSAVAGVLLRPRTKLGDREVFSRWVWLFLVLPIVAFGISAAKTYKDGVDAAAARTEAKRDARTAEDRRKLEAVALRQQLALSDTRRRLELSLAEKRRKQEADAAEGRRRQEAQAAQARLAIVQSKVDQSINRVSYFQANVSWEFKSSELDLRERAKSFMKSYLAIYTEIRQSGDKNIYGFSSAMFDNWRSADTDERLFFGDVESSVKRIATASGGIIFIGKPGSRLFTELPKRVSARFGFPQISLEDLPPTVVWYPLVNPRASLPTPPLPTISAQWDWTIPDKDAKDPLIVVGWIDRILSDRSATFIAQHDYEGAEVVLFLPRPNPDLDDAPSLGAFGEPVGIPVSASVDIGGAKWVWDSSRSGDRIGLRVGSPNQKYVAGYLIQLRAQ